MPARNIPLINDQYYHIFNRGIDRRPTFTSLSEYRRMIHCLWFYQFSKPPFKLSRFLSLSQKDAEVEMIRLSAAQKSIEIIAYCLMPNHFHILVRQTVDNGISHAVSNILNSYTRYFNTKHERMGPLFGTQFKVVRIESDEQLLHVCRYIHLNPYTSYAIKTLDELRNYPWSSIAEYLTQQKKICQTQEIMSQFKDVESFERFTFDQADYQRELDSIKHLLLDE